MKRYFKFFIYLSLFVLGFAGVKDFCQKKTQGFSLQKVVSQTPFNPKKEASQTLSLDELSSIRQILNQPYHFLKRGLQCYVFVSEDDQYVLKFFRWGQIEAPLWSQYLPSSWVKKLQGRKEAQKNHDFMSYKIASEELQEETGTLFLHLEKTSFLKVPLCLFDPLKIHHHLESDQIEFILQKKTDLFLPYFEKNKQNKQELHSFFSHFANLLKNRIQKQISDSDISLEYNMGVLDGKPVLFDIGNLTKKNSTLQQESQLVLHWLKNNDPELALFLEELLK